MTYRIILTAFIWWKCRLIHQQIFHKRKRSVLCNKNLIKLTQITRRTWIWNKHMICCISSTFSSGVVHYNLGNPEQIKLTNLLSWQDCPLVSLVCCFLDRTLQIIRIPRQLSTDIVYAEGPCYTWLSQSAWQNCL